MVCVEQHLCYNNSQNNRNQRIPNGVELVNRVLYDFNMERVGRAPAAGMVLRSTRFEFELKVRLFQTHPKAFMENISKDDYFYTYFSYVRKMTDLQSDLDINWRLYLKNRVHHSKAINLANALRRRVEINPYFSLLYFPMAREAIREYGPDIVNHFLEILKVEDKCYNVLKFILSSDD